MVKYHVTIVWNKCLPTKNIFFKQLVDDIYQSPRFLAISWHSQYNSFTQNSKGLMFLLLFMPLEHPLILENHVNLFQKQYNSFIKNLFLIRKKRKALKRGEGAGVLSAPNPLSSAPIISYTTYSEEFYDLMICCLPSRVLNISHLNECLVLELRFNSVNQ